MAHKSALRSIMGQRIPVVPGRGVPLQPAYHRGPRTIATSPKLLAFRSCISAALAGTSPGTRMKARENFIAAAKKCK